MLSLPMAGGLICRDNRNNGVASSLLTKMKNKDLHLCLFVFSQNSQAHTLTLLEFWREMHNKMIVKGSNLLLSLASFYCITMLCPDH